MNYFKSDKFKKDLTVLSIIIFLFFLTIFIFTHYTDDLINPTPLSNIPIIIFIFSFVISFYFYYTMPLLSDLKEDKEEVKAKAIIIFSIISICTVIFYLLNGLKYNTYKT